MALKKSTSKIQSLAEGMCLVYPRCQDYSCRLQHLPQNCYFYDSFCSLDVLDSVYKITLADIAYPAQLQGIITNFSRPQQYKELPLITKNKGIFATVGLCPERSAYINQKSRNIRARMLNLIEHPKVLGVGETGLIHKDRRGMKQTEKNHFKAYHYHLQLACEIGKPLVLYCDDRHNDMIKAARYILNKNHPLHMHGFSGTLDEAETWLFHFPNIKLGFNNNISDRKLPDLRHAAKHLPLESILIESDAPIYRPGNIRYPYQFTHPGMVINVATVIAQLKNISLLEVITQTAENCEKVYNTLQKSHGYTQGENVCY